MNKRIEASRFAVAVRCCSARLFPSVILANLSVSVIVLTLFVSTVEAQISWRSGASGAASRAPTQPAQVLAEATQAGEQHVVIHLNRPATTDIRAQLEAKGIALQVFFGDQSFFARIPAAGVDAVIAQQIGAITDVQRIQLAWKLHPMLARGEKPAWAIAPRDAAENMSDESPQIVGDARRPQHR